MVLIEDFAGYLGLPAWFVGGVTGLIAMTIILVVLIKKFRAGGLVLTFFVLFMSVANWAIFAWPLWASIVVGVGTLWGVVR